MEGTENDKAYIGKVVGYSAEPFEATVSASSGIGALAVNKPGDTLKNGNSAYYDFTLDNSTKVNFLLKDISNGNKTNEETLTLIDLRNNKTIYTFCEEATPNIDKSLYLNKGSYRVRRYNGNSWYNSQMDIKITVY